MLGLCKGSVQCSMLRGLRATKLLPSMQGSIARLQPRAYLDELESFDLDLFS